MPATPSPNPTKNIAHPYITGGKRQTIWQAALLLSLFLISMDSWLRIKRIDAATHAPGFALPELVEDTASPSGYRAGVHELALPGGAADSQHWIMQTEQMFASGDIRIRHVNYDNAPAGREMHWASPYRWWIGLITRFLQATTGNPLPRCIESAALYSNPLMLALALLATTPWVARRFGPYSAAVFCLGLVGMLPSFDCFNAGAPDHHGLAILCGIFTLLFLVAGCLPSQPGADQKPAQTAKLFFIASGIAGGLGLWISAATQVLVLVGIGLGALAFIAYTRQSSRSDQSPYKPQHWLTWAQAGALTSLIGYAIEYLPAHASWRLEVNHPLYALAWLGAGQLLCAIALRVDQKPTTTAKNALLLNGAATLAILILPLVILIDSRDCFHVSDPFLWALHKNYIDEFQNIAQLFKQGFHIVTLCTLFPLGLLIIPAFKIWRKSPDGLQRRMVALAFIPGGFVTLFALQQIRWMGLSDALLLVGLVFVTSQLYFAGLSHTARRAILILTATVFIGQPLRTCWALQEDRTLSQPDLANLRIRDLSHWLRFRAGRDDVIVASSPTLTTPLIFFGGLRGLGTFYWENIDGLKTSAALFSAQSFEEAHRIVLEHGITHIVLASWDSFVREYVGLSSQSKSEAELLDSAFAAQLVKNRAMPPWLRLVPYNLPNLPASSTDEVLVFEVIPEKTPETSLTNLAHYFVDMGLPQTARKLLPALERDPQNLNAIIARARIHLAQQNRAGFDAAVALLPSALPSDAQLDLDESLHFAALKTIAGHNDSAHQQLLACLARIDAKAARKLSPSAAYALLALGRQFDLPLTVEIANLAAKLIAPELREQLFGRSGQAQP